jgi:predicted MPP superfamily phosphohydrolase
MAFPLTFVHLSDLHIRALDFRTGYNPDQDLRVELKHDLKRILEEAGTPRGILLGGDTAFAGQKEEFDAAVEWLHDLCEEIGVDPKDSVWVVPGNHDVDRGAVTNSEAIHSFQRRVRELRERRAHEVDVQLRRSLVEDPHGHFLLSPLDAYNDFALRFGCPTTRTQLFWERDFPLNDGWTLRMRGANSAIISGPDDNQWANKLVLGTVQATPSRGEGVAHLLLCHHPPDWLLNADELEDFLNTRYQVQLFGHKHRLRTQRIDRTVKIGSGALHPDRGEDGWESRYNVLQVWVEGEADAPALHVKVWRRRWDPAMTEFVADGVPWKENVPLGRWRAPAASAASHPETVPHPAPAAHHTTEAVKGAMATIRELVYDFYDLPFESRLRVLLEIGQLREDERHLPESERDTRIFQRIEADCLQARFKEAIQNQQAH